MIEFDKVGKRYGNLVAVDSLSFKVEEGQTTVLIGPSGCGKTTSLRMVNRMVEPSDGYVYVNGKPVKSFSAEQLRRGIGYVIQSIGLLPHMTVRDNITIVPKLLGWKREERYRRSEELLRLIGMDPEVYLYKHPAELSGGEAQRIGVARALAADPPILLMDEPFGAVDPLNRENLQNEFIALQKKLKKTVIFVTHDLDEAVKIADKIVLLREGRLVQEDSPERLLAAPKNNFVREFVGDDRALKRLACFRVEDHMRPVRAATVEAVSRGPAANSEPPGRESTVKEEGAVGSASSVSSAYVGPHTSVRDALSKILGRGLREIPVRDEDGRLLGNIFLEDIEKLNQFSTDQ
ncbi:MAG: ABC transporter ATP-binding protein [Spirochaetaceae bacterium]